MINYEIFKFFDCFSILQIILKHNLYFVEKNKI